MPVFKLKINETIIAKIDKNPKFYILLEIDRDSTSRKID